MNSKFYDVTVVGGGPVGMFTAFYAGLRDANVQLIESLGELGGQVNALYPYKTVLDVGGYAGLTGKSLVANLKQQMITTHPTVRLKQAVTNIEPIHGGYQITTNQSQTKTRAVIIAIGSGAFNPRKLMAKNADRFTDHQLFYSVKDLKPFRNKTVLVAGGGNSALDNALLLNKVAKQVYLLHRRNQFRGLESMVDRLKRSSVKMITPYLIRQLDSADNGQVLVKAKKMRTDHDFKTIPVDDLVVNYGFIANDRALRKWQLPLKEHLRRLPVNSKLQTNLKNVYSVGDCADYPGKDTLIATGFGEAPIAVNSIMRTLYPHRRMPLHSTSLHR